MDKNSCDSGADNVLSGLTCWRADARRTGRTAIYPRFVRQQRNSRFQNTKQLAAGNYPDDTNTVTTRNTVNLFGVYGDILALQSRRSTTSLCVEIHTLYILSDVSFFHFWQLRQHLPGCDFVNRVLIFTIR